ncbi:MAG: tRNA lysidine(34) synthetase TilS [Clostridiales bacterium]|nr:tRNA lysidine(34) synthetase TilS [Clostridiales bacterium]
MSLDRRVEAYCRRMGFPLERGDVVLCAVSGGVDSMALLHLLWRWSRREGFSLTAATFDHGLREAGAEDVNFVCRWCGERDIPVRTGRGDVPARVRDTGETTEEAARVLRYAFLEDCAGALGADWIATAHQADDNAETLLLHLLRGSGLRGLGGIPPRRGKLIRPLLEVTREELTAYARANAIPWREDASNDDTAYTRNFVRHQVMPLLKERNPNLARTLGRTAESLRLDEGYLDGLARERGAQLLRQEPEGVSVSVNDLLAQPEAIALRLIQLMVETVRPGTVLPWEQRRRMLTLAAGESPSARCSLTAGLRGLRVYDRLVVTAERPPLEKPELVELAPGGEAEFPDLDMTIMCRSCLCPETPEAGCLYLRPPQGALLLRPRQAGDRIQLPGQCRKRLKKLLIEKKIPRERREHCLVLEAEGRVVAVLGVGTDTSWIPQPGSGAWQIIIQNRDGNRKDRC